MKFWPRGKLVVCPPESPPSQTRSPNCATARDERRSAAGWRSSQWRVLLEREGRSSAWEWFKSAGVRLRSVDEINLKDLKRWLRKSAIIQWDYKNIVKRKGKLVRLM